MSNSSLTSFVNSTDNDTIYNALSFIDKHTFNISYFALNNVNYGSIFTNTALALIASSIVFIGSNAPLTRAESAPEEIEQKKIETEKVEELQEEYYQDYESEESDEVEEEEEAEIDQDYQGYASDEDSDEEEGTEWERRQKSREIFYQLLDLVDNKDLYLNEE